MTMEGADLIATPPHKIVETGIAHVPEGRRLFPRLSVEDNLRMGAYIPAARKKFAERLDYVYTLFPRLKERRGQLAGTMSGGEQQMCAIARTLDERAEAGAARRAVDGPRPRDRRCRCSTSCAASAPRATPC